MDEIITLDIRTSTFFVATRVGDMELNRRKPMQKSLDIGLATDAGVLRRG